MSLQSYDMLVAPYTGMVPWGLWAVALFTCGCFACCTLWPLCCMGIGPPVHDIVGKHMSKAPRLFNMGRLQRGLGRAARASRATAAAAGLGAARIGARGRPPGIRGPPPPLWGLGPSAEGPGSGGRGAVSVGVGTQKYEINPQL